MYRRRRLFAGGALVLVLGLIAGGVATVSAAVSAKTEQVASTEGRGSAQPTGGQAAPSASPSATPSASPVCDQKLVTVTAATNKASYGPEEKPVLTLKVTNGGKLPCKVNIGTSQMEFLVTSGSDRDLLVRRLPGRQQRPREDHRPRQERDGELPVAAQPLGAGLRENPEGSGAGSGYYVFIAKLGAKVSPPAVFQLS